jgi:hypothetical protein
MSAPQTLYAITEEYRALDQLLAEAEEAGQDLSSPEVAEIVTRWWLALDGDLTAKAHRCIAVIREQEGLSELAKAEAARLAAYAASKAARAARVRDAVHAAMQVAQVKRLDTPLGAVTVASNGGKAPLVVADDVDPLMVQDDYTDLVEVKASINKAAVRDALEHGQPLPFAAIGERGTHLRIR